MSDNQKIKEFNIEYDKLCHTLGNPVPEEALPYYYEWLERIASECVNITEQVNV